MTTTRVEGGAAQPVRIVNVEYDADVAARGVKGGAAIPVYVTNFSDDGSGANIGSVSSGDYTEFENDGTMQAHGDATCYRDELQSVTAAKLTSPSNDFEQNDAEGSITAKTSARYPTDYVSMKLQLNHDWALGTRIYPHLHWWQTSSSTPNWLIEYRWQKQGSVKTTAWSKLKWSDNAFDWSTGVLNQITVFSYINPPAGYGQVSDIVQFRLYRDYTDASLEFGAGDPVNASQDFVNFDIHIEVDMLGSHEEYIK
jgi:hypothetical protein